MDLNELRPELRARIAELWANDALLEHASIASFARFSLELLAVAAPPDLVIATHRAALDEIEHAKLCFGIASRYAGNAMGPGPLSLGDELAVRVELSELAAATVVEGCVGETLGALEASAALEHAEPSDVRQALERIARDEERHAELSWKFVHWALAQNDEKTRDAVRRAFDQALAGVSGPVPEPDPDALELARHGRLDARSLHLIRARALEEAVIPAFRALLGLAPS